MTYKSPIPQIGAALCVLGLSLSTFLAVTSTYEIACSHWHLLGVAVFSLLFSCLLGLKGKWRLLTLPVLGGFCAYVYYFWDAVLSSLQEVGNHYIRAFNAYNGGMTGWTSAYFSNDDPGLFMLGFLLSLGVCCGVFLFRSSLVAALPLGIVIGAGLFTAQFPPVPVLGLGVLALGVLPVTALLKRQLVSGSGPKERALSRRFFLLGVAMLCLLTALLGVAAVALTPQVQQQTGRLKKLQNRLIQDMPAKQLQEVTETTWKLSEKDQPKRYQLNNSPIVFQNEFQMEVSADLPPGETLYLKSQAFSSYHDGLWEPIQYTNFDRFLKAESLKAADVLTPPTDNPDMGAPVELTVTRQAGVPDHMPYRSRLPQGAVPVGDGYLRNLQNPQVFTLYADNWESEESAPSAYESFVRQEYLELPPNTQGLKELAEGLQADSPLELAGLIRQTLGGLAQYSMNLPALPPGADYVENFLFTQKKGYCQHFASAAVLLFRLKGVPARFATGYALPPDLFEEEGGRYTAVVNDTLAHAWPEIYLSGVGWVPVEATPGGVEAQLNASGAEPENIPGASAAPAATKKPETASSQAPAVSSRPEPTPQAAQSSGGPELSGWLWYGVWGAAAVLLPVLILFLRRKYLEYRRSNGGAVQPLVADLMTMLEFCLDSRQNELSDREFLLRSFREARLEDGDLVADLAYDAAFSGKGDAAHREALARLKTLYRTAAQTLRPRLSLWKKLQFDWIFCFGIARGR